MAITRRQKRGTKMAAKKKQGRDKNKRLVTYDELVEIYRPLKDAVGLAAQGLLIMKTEELEAIEMTGLKNIEDATSILSKFSKDLFGEASSLSAIGGLNGKELPEL